MGLAREGQGANSASMHIDIASSSLRELDAVALATNATVFMGRHFWCNEQGTLV